MIGVIGTLAKSLLPGLVGWAANKFSNSSSPRIGNARNIVGSLLKSNTVTKMIKEAKKGYNSNKYDIPEPEFDFKEHVEDDEESFEPEETQNRQKKIRKVFKKKTQRRK